MTCKLDSGGKTDAATSFEPGEALQAGACRAVPVLGITATLNYFHRLVFRTRSKICCICFISQELSRIFFGKDHFFKFVKTWKLEAYDN